MSGQKRLDDRSLDAPSAPVDQPHLPKPPLVGRPEIFVHHGGNVPGREGVKVERVFNGKKDRVVRHGGAKVWDLP